MTNYDAPLFGGIQGVDSVETEASAGGAVGMKAAATGGAQGHSIGGGVGWGGVARAVGVQWVGLW